MTSDRSSLPMFPPIHRASTPRRVLALYDKGNIYTENGDHFIVSDYTGLYDTMFQENLYLFVDSIADYENFRFLHNLVIDKRAVVTCSKKGTAIGARLSNGRRSAWIIPLSTWGLDYELASILKLRRLFHYIGIGDYPTPARLGRELLFHVWRQYRLPRHTQPNGFCCEYLHKNQSGGRADTPGLGMHFDETIEVDKASGYVSKFHVFQTGTSTPFKNKRGNFHEEFPTWFGECRIEIPEDMPLGPFPVRLRDRNNLFDRIEYPRMKGVYTAFIWNETYDMCKRYGLDVRPVEGYGWHELTDDTHLWAELSYNIKMWAEYEYIEEMWKRCIVACIGSTGTNQTYYILVPQEEVQTEDRIHYVDRREAYEWCILEKQNLDQPRMLHWYGLNIARVSNDVFDTAFPYAADGRLICTNYDSVMFQIKDLESDTRPYVSRDAGFKVPAGTWRYQILHNVTIIAPRSISSDEKIRMPGVNRKDR